MHAGLAMLGKLSNERARTRLEALEPSPSARITFQALFAVALPTDLESRRFHLLWTSYAMLAMTGLPQENWSGNCPPRCAIPLNYSGLEPHHLSVMA